MKIICGVEAVKASPLCPYSDSVCDFLDAFGMALRRDALSKQYPDVMTFAFWARKANICKKKEQYLKKESDRMRLGRGIAFHIAPSNVPVNCMFSYAFGLLAGNGNIVRLPSKEYPQLECMCRVLSELLKEERFKCIYEMTSFVRYSRDNKEATQLYSSICDVRIIWGGDNTIRDIRRFELPAGSIEITFPDRYSFGIIDVSTLLEMSEEKIEKLSSDFYNDTYLMDQNACSTPHLICFRKGEASKDEVNSAKDLFWNGVHKSAGKYDLADIKASDKYSDLCERVMNSSVENIRSWDNLLYVCEIESIPEDVTLCCRGRYGLFYEYTYGELEELSPLSDTRVQTCAVLGIDSDDIRKHVLEHGYKGITRVVPFGKTLDIDVIWDGYDLIASMSRIIA